MNSLLRDLKYSLRVQMKSPGLTALAVLTLAVGIGATTAIFSVVYGVLLRPLPYPKPDQIVELNELNDKGGRMNFADPNFEDIRSGTHTLAGVAEYSAWLHVVSGGAEPTREMPATVSRDFFRVMGVGPMRGREFTEEDQRLGAAPVALVSYGYWQRTLGSPDDLSTIKLKIGDQPFAVIGVMPPGFEFPLESDLWIPRELYEKLPSRTAHNWHVVARVREGVAIGQTRADLSAIARRLKQLYGEDTMMTDVGVMKLQDSLTHSVRPALLILLGAVGFLLLVACANVANLLLAQAAGRERELAIRCALGAERKRLVLQFLAESLVLCMVGGAFGVLSAAWGVDAILASAPGGLPRLQDVSVNLPVLLFALLISLLVALGLGIFTALRATSVDPQDALSEGGVSRTGSVRHQRLGRGIVAAQLAITLVLLVGAGLLGRSLLRVLSVDPGFKTDHVLTIDLALPSAEKETDQFRRVQFLVGVLAQVRALPGVQEVGGTSSLPLTEGLADGTYVLMNPGEKLPDNRQGLEQLFHDPNRTGDADYCVASEGYFRALGIPLVRGRLFDDRDTMDAPHVALISESLAREKWPNQDPLGHAIEFGNMDGDLRLLTVVGVVGDIRENSLERTPRPTIYVNLRQRPQAFSHFTVVVHAGSDPGATFAAARQIVHNLAPEVPPRFGTFEEVYAASLRSRRFNLTLVGIFAAAALLLAVAGIFGVMAYSVSRRTREFGIRLALGAKKQDILRLVLRQALVTATIGVAGGMAGAFMLTRLMQSLLFDVGATDPATLASVILILSLAALAASYIPARRAAKVDPMVALRYE
jgi:putative ABC transport system permease protein